MGIRGHIARKRAFPKPKRTSFSALEGKIEVKRKRKIGPIRIESSTKYTPEGKFASSWRRVKRPSLRHPTRKVVKTTIVSKAKGQRRKTVIIEAPGKKPYETRRTVKTKSKKTETKTR